MTRVQELKVSLKALADALVAPVWYSLRLTGHATCPAAACPRSSHRSLRCSAASRTWDAYRLLWPLGLLAYMMLVHLLRHTTQSLR